MVWLTKAHSMTTNHVGNCYEQHPSPTKPSHFSECVSHKDVEYTKSDLRASWCIQSRRVAHISRGFLWHK